MELPVGSRAKNSSPKTLPFFARLPRKFLFLGLKKSGKIIL